MQSKRKTGYFEGVFIGKFDVKNFMSEHIQRIALFANFVDLFSRSITGKWEKLSLH